MNIYKTGHRINAIILSSIENAVGKRAYHVDDYTPHAPSTEPVVVHGILRGTVPIMYHQRKKGLPYFYIDNGFIGHTHFTGNYRVSLNSLQATFVQNIKDHVESPRKDETTILETNKLGEKILLLPPTPAICEFYGINISDWIRQATNTLSKYERPVKIRFKDKKYDTNLQQDIMDSCFVYAFNSSACLEALRLGIPAWQEAGILTSMVNYIHSMETNLLAKETYSCLMESRKEIFDYISNINLPLPELERKNVWTKTMDFLYTSDLIIEKSSLTRFANTQLKDAPQSPSILSRSITGN